MIPNILSIAGSDPSGGAGVQADLKTFSALGCYGMAVLTGLTAQNTTGVQDVYELPHHFVMQQAEALFSDIRIDAIKIGMAGSPQTIGVLAEMVQRHQPRNVVLDPVMVATSGDRLLSLDAVKALKTQLIPIADVITPNIPEAEILLGKSLDSDFTGSLEDMAQAVLEQCSARAVLLKGGHVKNAFSIDVYIDRQGGKACFEHPRIDTKNTHGTGCTLSSALACWLAKGLPPAEAVLAAKKYVAQAIQASDILNVGQGSGPVHHFHALWP